MAPQTIADDLKRESMFEIRNKNDDEYVDVEKGHLYKLVPGKIKIMFEDRTLLEEEDVDKNYVDGIKRIVYNFFTVEPKSVGETDDILRIFNNPQSDVNMDELFEKYSAEEVWTNMNVIGAQLPIEKCRETFYSNSSSWFKRLNVSFLSQNSNSLLGGLFKGDYGPHGVELIHLQAPHSGIKGLKGIKVTGDPNVPFNKITFEVENDRCLNISEEAQQTCNSIIQFHQNPQFVDYKVKGKEKKKQITILIS